MLTAPSYIAFVSVAESGRHLVLGLGSDARSLPDSNVNSNAWLCTVCFTRLLAFGLVAHEGKPGCRQE